MATRKIQNNFGGGEISPTLFGRSDLAAYYKACAKAENFIVTKEGTLRKRNGITTALSSDISRAFDNEDIRIFPYLFDRENSGVLVLHMAKGSTDVKGTFYRKNGVRIGNQGMTIASNITSANFKLVQCKQIGDQLWLSGGGIFKIVSVNNFDTNASITIKEWTQAETPKGVASFSCTGYNSSGDVYSDSSSTSVYYYCAYVVKDGVMSEKETNSAYQKKAWEAGAYVKCTVTVDVNESFDYIVIGKSSGGPTNFGEICRYYPEDIDDDGKVVFQDKNINPGDAIYSQTNVMGEVFEKPLCVDCFQQRKVFANAFLSERKKLKLATSSNTITVPDGIYDLLVAKKSKSGDNLESSAVESITGNTIKFKESAKWYIEYYSALSGYPMTLWFSEVGNLDNFYANRPSSDADAFSPTISSIGPAFIRWTISYQEMLVLFTDCGIFSVGFSQSQGFSASSCRITRCSTIAVSPTIAPTQCDAGVVFVAADNKTVYTLSFDLQENMLKPTNRLVLADHLTRKNAIVAMAAQSSPDNTIWCALSDGTLAIFTFERTEEVFAWSSAKLANGKVRDIISLGSYTDMTSGRTQSDLVFVVEPNDNSNRCILAKLSDGYTDVISTSSNVKATLVTLQTESQDRTIAGRKKNVKDTLLRLHETGGLSVKPTKGDTLIALAAPLGSSLFTGDVKIMPRGYINEAGQMTFVSDNDKPCEILQIVNDVEIFD